MHAKVTFCSTAAIITIALFLMPGGTATTHAEPQAKKKSVPNRIDGAIWQFAALARDGKAIRFRYRISNLTIYDIDTGKVIGKSEALTESKSRVTFNKDSQFPEVFLINRQEGGHWTGRAEYQGKSWTIDLRGRQR